MKTKYEIFIAGKFMCYKCNREVKGLRVNARHYCKHCKTELFEAGAYLINLLKCGADELTPEQRKTLRKWIAADYPQCDHCKQRFKFIVKHVKKNTVPLIPWLIPWSSFNVALTPTDDERDVRAYPRRR